MSLTERKICEYNIQEIKSKKNNNNNNTFLVLSEKKQHEK